MSWKLRADIAAKPHEQFGAAPAAVFELDSRALVALAIATAPTPAATLACVASCWLVDADGDPQGVNGVPVLSTFQHVADVSLLSDLGVQGIAEALRDLLLGEPPADPPLIPWPEQLRAQVSIRNVIAVATAAGTPIDWSSP